jgi:hypothetical protein
MTVPGGLLCCSLFRDEDQWARMGPYPDSGPSGGGRRVRPSCRRPYPNTRKTPAFRRGGDFYGAAICGNFLSLRGRIRDEAGALMHAPPPLGGSEELT